MKRLLTILFLLVIVKSFISAAPCSISAAKEPIKTYAANTDVAVKNNQEEDLEIRPMDVLIFKFN